MTWVRTFADDCLAREPADFPVGGYTAKMYKDKCLSELVRAVRYHYLPNAGHYANERHVVSVEISRIILRADGYTAGGTYYGRGLPVFELGLSFESDAGPEPMAWRTVRAFDRKSLRADLANMFRHAKISR